MLSDLRIQRIAKPILPLLEKGDSILDIGCGSAELGTIILNHKKVSYQGVEVVDFQPKDKRIKMTKSQIPYPFKDKSFDVILLVLTLHHMNNPEKGLQEAMRLAKKKIIILEDVPRNSIERGCMKFIDFIGNKIISKDIPIPFNFLSDKQWKALFNKYKLTLKSQATVHPLPFPRLHHPLYELNL